MSDSGLSILLPPGSRDDGTQPGDTGQRLTPAESTSPVLGITLNGGQQVTLSEQVLVAGRITWREARRRLAAIRHQRGGLLNHLVNAKPPSVQEQCDYAQARPWVPQGHSGGFIEAHGVVFHAVIGRPGVAVGNMIAGIHHRPSVWCPTAFFALVLTLTGLCVTGNSVAAVILGAALGVLAVAWCLAAEAVRHSLNPRVTGADDNYAARPDADDDAQLHADA